jgi:hypothetical protein
MRSLEREKRGREGGREEGRKGGRGEEGWDTVCGYKEGHGDITYKEGRGVCTSGCSVIIERRGVVCAPQNTV